MLTLEIYPSYFKTFAIYLFALGYFCSNVHGYLIIVNVANQWLPSTFNVLLCPYHRGFGLSKVYIRPVLDRLLNHSVDNSSMCVLVHYIYTNLHRGSFFLQVCIDNLVSWICIIFRLISNDIQISCNFLCFSLEKVYVHLFRLFSNFHRGLFFLQMHSTLLLVLVCMIEWLTLKSLGLICQKWHALFSRKGPSTCVELFVNLRRGNASSKYLLLPYMCRCVLSIEWPLILFYYFWPIVVILLKVIICSPV